MLRFRRPKRAILILRVKRILEGNAQPDDYLPVSHEVEVEIVAVIARLKEETGITDIPEDANSRIRHDFTLQYHCGGKETLCQRSERGVIVLAEGTDNIEKLRKQIAPQLRRGFVIEYPHPWPRG